MYHFTILHVDTDAGRETSVNVAASDFDSLVRAFSVITGSEADLHGNGATFTVSSGCLSIIPFYGKGP